MTDDSTPVLMGNPDMELVLRDFRKPAVLPGVYTVEAGQQLIDADPGSPTYNQRVDTDPPLETATQSYEFRPLQFSLDEGYVHACYPADGSVGRYPQVLPHVTLNRDILPWERQLIGARVAGDAPWVALLVFAVEELADQGEAVSRPVTDLLQPPPGVVGPAINSQTVPPDILASDCDVIDVPAALFAAVVPREEELHFLAHTRQVSLPTTRADGEVLTEGDFSVVIANRFPREPGGYVVHLVSLEGYIGRLSPGAIPDDQLVRLCSLYSWTFVCDTVNTSDPYALLQGLVAPTTTPPVSPADAERLALRLTPDPEAKLSDYARRRLENGFVPVSYRLTTGELTLAWYRGPGTPLTAPALPAPLAPSPQPSSDYLLIYEPDHAVFDVSYACAWALGRAIGLSDAGYAEEIVRARRQLANRATQLALLALDPHRRAVEPEDVTGVRAFTQLAERGPGALVAMAAPQTTVPTPPAARQGALALSSIVSVLGMRQTRAQLTRTASQLAGAMPNWLDRLALLDGVPFGMLVPDPVMLPPESLRMFRIDQGWITSLLDGARDVAAATGLDFALDPFLRGATGNTRNQSSPAAAGLLIRSQLVIDWPEFDVTTTHNGQALNELRRELVAPDTILLFYDRIPDEVFIREPGAGIHFSINGASRISLRQLDPAPGATPPLGAPLTTEFPDRASGETVFDYLRPPTAADRLPEVMDLRGPRGLVRALAEALGYTDLTCAQFGLELTSAPYQQRLRPYDGSAIDMPGGPE